MHLFFKERASYVSQPNQPQAQNISASSGKFYKNNILRNTLCKRRLICDHICAYNYVCGLGGTRQKQNLQIAGYYIQLESKFEKYVHLQKVVCIKYSRLHC